VGQEVETEMESASRRGSVSSIAEIAIPDRAASKSTTRSLQWKTLVVVMTASSALVVLYGLWLTRIAILIVFASLLAAVALSSLCTFVEFWTGLRRRWSLPLVLLAFIGALSLGAWLRGPAIENQIDRLQTSLPQATRDFVVQLRSHEWGQWLVTHGLAPEQVPRLMDVLPKVTGVVSGTLGFLGGLLIILFLAIVISAEPQPYRRWFEQLFPLASHAYVNQVIDRVAGVLRLWLFARLVSMCAVGIMVSVGLWALRIPMAGMLGVLAGVLTFIPNVGPVLSAIPPILLAFTSSPRNAVFVVLLFWAVHALEGFLITPIANRAAVDLPPGLTLSAQLLLAFLAGGIGIALAAPLTAVVLVLVRTVYKEKVLSELDSSS
jgi:predicted PurR-regulated permease PerM